MTSLVKHVLQPTIRFFLSSSMYRNLTADTRRVIFCKKRGLIHTHILPTEKQVAYTNELLQQDNINNIVIEYQSKKNSHTNYFSFLHFSIYFSINHTKDKQNNNNNAIHYKQRKDKVVLCFGYGIRIWACIGRKIEITSV